MRDFGRALFVSLSVIILVFVLIFSFELVNRTVEKSGFSSGEVLSVRIEEKVISGEFLGSGFRLDISPFFAILPALGAVLFIIPPPVRFFILLFSVLM